MNLCVIQPWYTSVSETFIGAHTERLPANVLLVHGQPPQVGDTPILSNSAQARITRFVNRVLPGSDDNLRSAAYKKVLRQTKADAVLAEYGPGGVMVMDVCDKLRIPLVVHFHGYDAYREDALREYSEDYRVLFRRAKAMVAVSREMRDQIISLGAPPDKVFCNPCGVDIDDFPLSNPAETKPILLTVGRFVGKKAPHLVILAFKKLKRRHPNAILRMIGDGPLFGVAQDLVRALGLRESVQLLGSQPHRIVQHEMGQARAFIQHSVEASDGDKEGTPVVILEAGASGLPVISTYHAGIPDVVVHEKTGLLVAERDVDGMADQMARVIEDTAFAAELGRAARERISKYFTMEKSINRLWSIIDGSIRETEMPALNHLPDADHAGLTRAEGNHSTYVTQESTKQ